MPAWPEITAAGLVIGILFGIFGVGGSSFATPALGLLGVPGLVAVAAPIPAVIPAALAGMVTYVRKGQVEWPIARWCIYGGVPGTVVGALLSNAVGGRALLVASGVVLALVGIRILAPVSDEQLTGHARRRPAVVIPAAVVIGLVTGMLANGGGFLLVPLYVLVLGLTMPESAGTSLVVISALSVPTLLTHWALGHINWVVAAAFGLGAIPGAIAGSVLAGRIHADHMRRTFGAILVAFAVYFIARQVRAV
jgi:uncharacterized membrane protein YfcA